VRLASIVAARSLGSSDYNEISLCLLTIVLAASIFTSAGICLAQQTDPSGAHLTSEVESGPGEVHSLDEGDAQGFETRPSGCASDRTRRKTAIRGVRLG
jgi:hypothetical protein